MAPEHPMIRNILSLADPATWQSSLELAEKTTAAWLNKVICHHFERIYLVGCGSSLYNGQVAKYLLEHFTHLPAEAVPAFAFAAYVEPAILSTKTLVIGISTTGGTQAVCDAIDCARQAGAPTLALTAYEDSPVTQHADATILTGGHMDTISVKTSSYVQALIALITVAARLAEARAAPCSDNEAGRDQWRTQILKASAGAVQLLAQQREKIQSLAKQFVGASKVFVLGSGPNAGTAEEAALKVIEMAKMPCEAQDLENFLHGRLREVDQVNPLFFIAPQGRASARVLDFLTVTHFVQAPAVVLTDELTSGIQALASHVIQMPGGLEEWVTPLLYIIPMYLFGYEMALNRGYDPNARRYPIVPQNVHYGDVLK
jgi:glutamine---fructose-6-phosphate transaminase (isomerizing)